MTAHTDVQIIEQDGKPAFAVVPYEYWLKLSGNDDSVFYPHEVVGYQLKQGLSLIAAWRKYKKLSQQQMADRLGITQPAMAQIEKQGAKPQGKTLARIASVLGVDVEQLRD